MPRIQFFGATHEYNTDRVKLGDVVEKAHPQAVVLSTHSSDGEAANIVSIQENVFFILFNKTFFIQDVSCVAMFPFHQKYLGSHLHDEWDAE